MSEMDQVVISEKRKYYSPQIMSDEFDLCEMARCALEEGNAGYKFLDKYYHGDSKNHENATHLFGMDRDNPGKLYPNEIARLLADKLVSAYTSILDEMRSGNEEQPAAGQAFLERQLSWFGKGHDVGDDITLANKDIDKNELIGFLESCLVDGTKMFTNEQKVFSKKFTKLYDKAFQREDKNKARDYGLSKINSLLEKHNIGYVVESSNDSKNKKTCWSVAMKPDSASSEFERE